MKPFLKWVGGKTQLLPHIEQVVPKDIDTYYEIFLGGGSVLFHILSLRKQNKIQVNNLKAYDINATLIETYQLIQTHVQDLDEQFQTLVKTYQSIESMKGTRHPSTEEDAKTSKESFYYWCRNQFNQETNKVKRCALFMFLNKTCFRGLYREGPNGFNVPFGHYKNPSFSSSQELQKIHEFIQDVDFQVADFQKSLILPSHDDFVYLDPPYAPETKTSFTKYHQLDFPLESHKKLFDLIHVTTELLIHNFS